MTKNFRNYFRFDRHKEIKNKIALAFFRRRLLQTLLQIVGGDLVDQSEVRFVEEKRNARLIAGLHLDYLSQKKHNAAERKENKPYKRL